MNKVRLGQSDEFINQIGYGAMTLEGVYGEIAEDNAIDTLCHAIDLDLMIDTADAYGDGHNEVLIKKAIKKSNRKPFIASKFGVVFDDKTPKSELKTGWGFSLKVNNSKEYAKYCINNTLKRLEVDQLDLWYAHWLDPNIPIEEVIDTMAEFVKQGKVKYIGLSNPTSEEVRRAHIIHPISAVQYEYSLWRREAEIELLPLLDKLGITLVAWSPLGAGFLTGEIDKLDKGDFRNNNPKFVGENFKKNKLQYQEISRIAKSLGITPAQLSLAWILHKKEGIIPIPGTRKISSLDENIKSGNVVLNDKILQEIEEIMPVGSANGNNLI